jgi:TRAP-type transport system periplasmic protein
MRLGVLCSCVMLGTFAFINISAYGASARSQELKISHQFTANVDSRDRAARVFVDELQKRAPHLAISIHPELSLKIPATEQLNAMLRGELAMTIYPLSYASDKIPEFAIGTFPFVPADQEMAARLKGSLFHRKLQSFAEANGFRILTWWWLPGGLASRQREVGGPETVKGLTGRTPGSDMDRLFVSAGSKIAGLMSSNDMVVAMKSGKLDYLVTSLESLVNFKIYEQSKFAMIGGVGGFMSLHPLIMSKMVWDGLTLDEQNAVDEAAETADKAFEAMQRDAEQRAVDAFTQKGVKVRKMTIDEYEAWNKVAKEIVWPEYRKLSPAANGLFVSLLTSLIQTGKPSR